MTDHSTPWPNGIPCWADITVTDIDRSKQFYADVFGWEYGPSGPEFGGYTNAQVGGRTVAGMAPPMEGWEDQSAWVVYLATDDVAAAHEAVIAAGGKPIMEPMEVGPFGHMGLWLDPTGALFGGWQAKEHVGFAVTEVNGTVAWVDLMSADFEKAKEFYANAFGFTYEAMGEDYAMFRSPARPEEPGGGMGAAGEGTPGWNVCFWADDLEGTLAKIGDAGGQVLGDIVDFEFGRFAPVAGPDGEVFVIYNPNRAA
ncbi:VOC family protein [Ammonicoccus fulvus]|uniref:VOC family protein n=1 Tax=Ammonicoccus fulvus TaxID=3138240 RepID=A0ABZ3FKS0_9ACTN